MGDSTKKELKAATKAQKKQAKAQGKQAKAALDRPTSEISPPQIPQKDPKEKGSSLVTFAEGVRGVLFLIFAVSLVIAILLPDIGQTLGMSEIIGKLIGHWAGKGVLVVIAAAFFIYGLKYLRAIK